MATRVGFEAGGHLRVDQPVTYIFEAGETIGYPSVAPDYPLAPVLKSGYVLRINPADGKVYLMDLTNGANYCGISEIAAKLGEKITVRFWGIVWLAVGATAVNAGNFVMAENGVGQNPGDVIPYDGVDHQTIIGRALASGGVRAGANYDLIPVLLRGF